MVSTGLGYDNRLQIFVKVQTVKRERNDLERWEKSRSNEVERKRNIISCTEEGEKALFNENWSDVFTHKPSCLSEPDEEFEMNEKKKKRIESFTPARTSSVS